MPNSSMSTTGVMSQGMASYDAALRTAHPQISSFVRFRAADVQSQILSIYDEGEYEGIPTLDHAKRGEYDPGSDFTIFHPRNIELALELVPEELRTPDAIQEHTTSGYVLSRKFNDALLAIVTADPRKLYIDNEEK